MKRRIFVCGAVGHNLGDAAIAMASTRVLRDLAPDRRFTVTSLREGALAEADWLDEIRASRRTPSGWVSLLSQVFSSDAVLLGGGSLFQDALSLGLIRGMLPYMDQIAFLATVARTPYATLSVGVDPISSLRGRRIARRVLARAEVIEVRDRASKQRAIEYGIDPARIHPGADPAFLWEQPEGEVLEHRGVAVAIPNEELWTGDRATSLLALVSRAADQDPDGVRLISMDERESEESLIYHQLYSALPGSIRRRVEIVPRTGRVADIVRVLRSCRVVVAMRLHAAILAAGHTRVLVWSRGAKSDALAEELGLPTLPRADKGSVVALPELESLPEVADGELRRVANARTRALESLTRISNWLATGIPERRDS